MIAWKLVQRALKQWYGDALRLPVRWENEEDTFKGKPHGTLRIRTVTGIGNDEQRPVDDLTKPPGTERTYELVGNRLLGVELRVKSRSQHPEEHAMFYIDRARTRLRAPWAKELFTKAGIAVNTILASVHNDHQFQDRIESEAVLEVSFAVSSCEIDLRSQHGIIDKTLISSDLQPMGDPLQLDDLLIDASGADPDATPEIEVFAGLDQVEAGADQVFV